MKQKQWCCQEAVPGIIASGTHDTSDRPVTSKQSLHEGRQAGQQTDGHRCQSNSKHSPAQTAGKWCALTPLWQETRVMLYTRFNKCARSHLLLGHTSTLFIDVHTFPNLQHVLEGLKLKLRWFSFLPSPKLNHPYPGKQAVSLLAVSHRSLDGLGGRGRAKLLLENWTRQIQCLLVWFWIPAKGCNNVWLLPEQLVLRWGTSTQRCPLAGESLDGHHVPRKWFEEQACMKEAASRQDKED